jgi:hypothetical protein
VRDVRSNAIAVREFGEQPLRQEPQVVSHDSREYLNFSHPSLLSPVDICSKTGRGLLQLAE